MGLRQREEVLRHAVNPSMGARERLHAAHGLKTSSLCLRPLSFSVFFKAGFFVVWHQTYGPGSFLL